MEGLSIIYQLCYSRHKATFQNMSPYYMGYNLLLHILAQTKTEAIYYLSINYTKSYQF
jgi:hypothetical protein